MKVWHLGWIIWVAIVVSRLHWRVLLLIPLLPKLTAGRACHPIPLAVLRNVGLKLWFLGCRYPTQLQAY